MLSKSLISSALIGVIPGFTNADTQIQEAQGLDTILELLTNLRSVEFPVAILEDRANGAIQLVEGPVDFFTQSIWIMGQFGRDESEADLYAETRALAIRVMAKLLDMAKNGEAALEGWNWRRTQYLKRYGGQNARGWELVLTFEENISLLMPEPEPVVPAEPAEPAPTETTEEPEG